MSIENRRVWTPEKKLKIVLESLSSEKSLSEICRREGLSPNLIYQWRKQLLEGAQAVFGKKTHGAEDRQTARLTADNQRMRRVIDGIIDHYNHCRLHSALNYLRPVDYYRGNPEVLPAERRRKLQLARSLRKQENIKLRQGLLPYPEVKTVA